MPSILPDFEYDIFISYRHKDNRGDQWVTEFVGALKAELDATFKDDISIYFDNNTHDGLLETHNVDKSLEGKLKCVIFIPIISHTYCDPRSFAWQHEFCAFNALSKADKFGRDIKLNSGNVGCRILPLKIHVLDDEDTALIEHELGGALRSIDFIFRSQGVNRPLRLVEDDPHRNLNKTYYRDQVNKVANAIKEIYAALRKSPASSQPARNSARPKKPASISLKQAVIACLVLCILTAGGYFLYSNWGGGGGVMFREKSIAVLPFVNMSNEPDQEYFSDGMTDEVLNRIYKIGNLKVISRLSSMRFKGTNLTSREIASQLGVRHILSGTVQRSGDRIKIAVQLVDAIADNQLWSETYERKYNDVFSIQSSIADAVATELKIKLNPYARKNTTMTNNMVAYDLYLRGNHFVNPIESELDTAIYYLKKSIAEDPQFALAYANLSRAYTMKTYWFPNPKTQMAMAALADQEATKALALDSTIADAYFSKAFALWTPTKNYPSEEVVRLYKKAIEINPNHDEALHQLGIVLMHNGQAPAAIKVLTNAIAVNPYNEVLKSDYPAGYFFNHDNTKYLALIAEMDKKLKNRDIILHLRGLAELYLNDEGAAKKMINDLPENHFFRISMAAITEALDGHKAESLALINKIEYNPVKPGHFHHAFYDIALAYAILGEKDKAVFCLRWSMEHGFPSYAFYRNDPILKRLNGYGPFEDLLTDLKDYNDRFVKVMN